MYSSHSSDSFPLEELLHRISIQASQQHVFTVRALGLEKEALQQELSVEQSRFTAIYSVLSRLGGVTPQLDEMLRRVEKRIDIAQKKWLANCTAL